MMSLMNHLVKRYLKKWDSELTGIKYQCPEIQAKELEFILRSPLIRYFHGKMSRLEFETKSLSTYSDYAYKVQELMDSQEVSCKYFAQSSGTSGTKKLIPTPDAFVKRNHLRGSWYQLHTMFEHNPKMSVFRAKNLLIGGSIYSKKKNQTIGDVSGIMLSRIPLYMRPWVVPKISEATQSDWEQKIQATAQGGADTPHMSILGGTPTWVLTTLRKTLQLSGKSMISDLWPNLQVYIHGGVNFLPYKDQFESLIDIPDFRYIEIYNATEGFFAYQDRPQDEGMLLMCASGVYFEFITLEDYRQDIHHIINISQVEINQSYVMLITTLSGLVRYVQGDIIRFVTAAPYRVKVEGRLGEYINAFGEDLMLPEAEESLIQTSSLHHCSIKQYTIAPRYISIHEPGYHEWFIEFEVAPIDLNSFALNLDAQLRRLNHNYDQKRTKDIAMKPLRLHVLPSGATMKYLKSVGTISGQTKLPRMRNDRSIANALAALV